MESTWSFYNQRHLTKRLNVMGWSVMRPPMWAMNMHVDMAWNQVFWMVENDWYSDSPDITTFEMWPLGQFRAMARTKSTMLIPKPWLRGFESEDPERNRVIRRSLMAMLLSHDLVSLPSHRAMPEFRRTLLRMGGLVNLSDTAECLFTGYWRSGHMVQPAGREVHASVYANEAMRTAAVLLVNGGKQDQYLAGTTLDVNAILPVRGEKLLARRTVDLETGETVVTDFDDGLYRIREPFLVDGHGFRLLGIEAE